MARTAIGAGAEALLSGHQARQAGDWNGAIDHLRRALATDSLPVADLAGAWLAEAQLEAGRPEDALASLAAADGAVVGSVRSKERAWLRARALDAAGRHAEAAAAWKDLTKSAAGKSLRRRAHRHRAEALERAGSSQAGSAWRSVALDHPRVAPEDALERAERLTRSAGQSWRAPDAAELLARADALASAHRHEQAAAAHGEAARAPGASVDTCLIRQARDLYKLRRNDEARQICVDLKKRFPDSKYKTAALHRRARVAWRLDDGAELLAVTEEGIESSRHRASSWRDDLLMVRAGYFMEKGRYDEAVATYERLVKEHPKTGLRRDALTKAAWCRLLQGKNGEASRRFGELASRDELGRAARYWHGRAAARAGDDVTALAAMRKLYRDHPFKHHGLAARDFLSTRLDPAMLAGLDAQIAAASTVFTLPPSPSLTTPAGVRYRFLRDLGLHHEALDELESLSKGRSDDAFRFELARARARDGRLQSAYGLLQRNFSDALRNPSRRSARELWEVVYPQPQGALLLGEAQRFGLDPSLVAALTRSESAWDADVVSPAGALGLMQLMPATAARMAAQEGDPPPTREDLFVPQRNLHLGCRYLSQLVALFGGDEAAAVASYNAGEHKVGEWWSRFDAKGVGRYERIDRIPYKETRRYVRKVLETAAWYRWLAQGDAESARAGS
ncbi:MAG: transglycosylase SLT domain-containing protein [Acidobacteriota bacterium]